MSKRIGFVIMLVALLLVFAGHSVAPSWFVNSTLGDIIFTVLVILLVVGLIMMVK